MQIIRWMCVILMVWCNTGLLVCSAVHIAFLSHFQLQPPSSLKKRGRVRKTIPDGFTSLRGISEQVGAPEVQCA